MKVSIIGLFPLTGNGGIASWTKKYLSTFPDNDFIITAINNSPLERKENNSFLVRITTGLKALRPIIKKVKNTIKKENPQILHTTTSGSLGSLRDYFVGKICKKKGVKTILHCRYGCITEDIKSNGIVGILLRNAMKQFDQIWVLDSRSYNTLKSLPKFADKVRLTPNSIEVPKSVDLSPKNYKRIGFVGNLIPTKGIFELIEAVKSLDVTLDIIGPGSDEVIEKIKKVSGDQFNKKIFLHGRLANEKAIEYIKQLDFIALPTYYPSEAFPISILEAMSRGKLVISCPRAAIKDMLTSATGVPCGLLVKEKSSESIADAIMWAQTHTEEADNMCRLAYEKVKSTYDTSHVYEIYRNNYRQILNN